MIRTRSRGFSQRFSARSAHRMWPAAHLHTSSSSSTARGSTPPHETPKRSPGPVPNSMPLPQDRSSSAAQVANDHGATDCASMKRMEEICHEAATGHEATGGTAARWRGSDQGIPGPTSPAKEKALAAWPRSNATAGSRRVALHEPPAACSRERRPAGGAVVRRSVAFALYLVLVARITATRAQLAALAVTALSPQIVRSHRVRSV